MSEQPEQKRPPWWRFRERDKYDAMKTSWDEVRARILTPEERKNFDVEIPYSMRSKPYDFVLYGLGLKEKKLPEGSGAAFVQSPYATIYTSVYGVTPINDLPKYRLMYRNQPDIQQAIQLQVTMSIGKGFTVEHKEKEIQEYCNKVVDDTNMLQNMIVLCTDMLVYGFASGEILWSDKILAKEKMYKYEDVELTAKEVLNAGLNGKVQDFYTTGSSGEQVDFYGDVVKRQDSSGSADEPVEYYGIKNLDPLYIRVRRDSFGNVFGYIQILTVPYTYLDSENVLFLKWRPTSTGYEDAYGHSTLMSLVKNYDLLNQFENDCYTWLHGRAVPPLIVKGGADPQHPYTTNQMQSLMDKLGGRTAATMIGVKSDVEVIEMLGAARNLNVSWYLDYLLTRRYQALGVPPLLMGVPEGSNRATGEVVFQDFITRLQLIQKLIADEFETQILHPLVKARFGKDTDKPRIVWKPIVEEDRNLRAARLLSALQGKAISVNEFRQAIGFDRIEDKPELDEVMPAPAVPPPGLNANPFAKPNQPAQGKPGEPEAKPFAKPPPEGTQKKENELLEQELRIKKMRLLISQESFHDELKSIIKRAQLEWKQGDRIIKDIKKEMMDRAKESVKKNVSNAFLYAKMDSLYSKYSQLGQDIPLDALNITKEDLPEITKLEKRYIKDFDAILTDMFKEASGESG